MLYITALGAHMWYLNDITNIKSTETKDLKLCLENVIRLKEMYGSMDYLNKVMWWGAIMHGERNRNEYRWKKKLVWACELKLEIAQKLW